MPKHLLAAAATILAAACTATDRHDASRAGLEDDLATVALDGPAAPSAALPPTDQPLAATTATG